MLGEVRALVPAGPAKRPLAATLVIVLSLLLGAMVVPATAAPTRHSAPEPPTASSVPPPVDGTGAGSELKDDYDEVSAEEAKLLGQIDEARAEQLRLTAELADLDAKVVEKRADLVRAEAALEASEVKADQEVVARQQADKRVVEAKEKLRKQIVASYVTGGVSNVDVLEAILRSDSGEEAGSAVVYSKAFVGSSDALVRGLIDAQRARRRAEQAANAARADAESRARAVADATKVLGAARDDKQRLLADKDAQVVLEQQGLDAVKARKASIESRIASLQRTSDSITALLGANQPAADLAAVGTVVITNPIPPYQVGSKFGLRKHPILGTVRLHAGADLGAPAGTVIRAAADGFVVSAGVRGGYGNATIIDHGSSLATLYGHQSRIDVKPGQFVKRGDPIGLVGSTGLSTGPHLHFETRINGVPVDPETIVDFKHPEVSYEADAKALADLVAEYQATLDAGN